jgi:hypothetical protein
MSVERILVTFKGDGTIRGIASYAVNGAAEEMTAETAAALLPHAALLAQLQAVQAENGSLADRVRAAEEARDAAGVEARALVATAEAEAQAAKDEAVLLKARIAELEGKPPADSGRTIHKAWLRAALASIERLAEVDAAVQAAGPVPWELWANATTISRDDADVVAIAAALSIDLDAVFAAARAIQAARAPA